MHDSSALRSSRVDHSTHGNAEQGWVMILASALVDQREKCSSSFIHRATFTVKQMKVCRLVAPAGLEGFRIQCRYAC